MVVGAVAVLVASASLVTCRCALDSAEARHRDAATEPATSDGCEAEASPQIASIASDVTRGRTGGVREIVRLRCRAHPPHDARRTSGGAPPGTRTALRSLFSHRTSFLC